MAEDGKSHLYDPKSVYQTAKIQNFSIMQAKPQKIIKLANRSRKNRVFFDQLIRMLAVELHLGSDELNRFHLMPVYVCHSHARETAHSEHYIQLNRDSGCLYQPLCEVLPAALIDQLEALLTDAPANLKGSKSKTLIGDYLKQHTDLTDCHLSALNEMRLFTDPAGVASH